MSYFDAIILGVLQGLTEFLPISSSGHLVLAQELLGLDQPGVSFEVLLHVGTLLAVLAYFRKRVVGLLRGLFVRSLKRERATLGYLVIGTVPAGLAGLLLRDLFEQAFTEPTLTAAMLIVTGAILLLGRVGKPGKNEVRAGSALLMGVGQALAILPGISRSGTTIVTGILAKVDPAEAAEFSFLLAVPAIGGAALLNFGNLLSLDSSLVGPYLAGTLAAFLLALVAVYAVLAAIKRGKFSYFAYYCFAAGAVGLYLFL